jgi:hypothetical protein
MVNGQLTIHEFNNEVQHLRKGIMRLRILSVWHLKHIVTFPLRKEIV